ncbi:YybH family protein [Arthrobacter sp. NPDC090010]|uniref:YybH family protein n=1 Tax=Arthrobacter sp. NPDC090010 TaxID=3363942 RepID=UPI0037F2362D
METPSTSRVEEAAAAIVRAFRDNDRAAYFGAFSEDASFVFHPEDRRLDDRAAYEQAWDGWRSAGWRVLECTSSQQLIQVYPGMAVFTHTVDTTVDPGDGSREQSTERESIIFRVDGDSLVAVHEHLSPVPAP